MKNCERVIDQIETGKQIKSEIKKYHEEIGKPSCDKYQIGFNVNSGFSSVIVTLNVGGYLGYRGDNQCSRLSLVRDEALFKRHFFKILHHHFEELMFETADSILSEALVYRDTVLKELQQKITELEAMKNPE